MTNATCSRPKKYHRSGGPWQRVLVVLARHGYPDRHIAACLQDLSREALAMLNGLAELEPEAIEEARETDMGRRWTRDMVIYHRRRLRVASRYDKYDHISMFTFGMRIARIV